MKTKSYRTSAAIFMLCIVGILLTAVATCAFGQKSDTVYLRPGQVFYDPLGFKYTVMAAPQTVPVFLPKNTEYKTQWKRVLPGCAALFVAGFSNGTNEAISHHYNTGFKRTFPKANDRFWNPEISWTNKYKNGDYQRGPAYWGSTDLLAWTTDGYHLTNSIRNVGVFAGTITVTLGSKRRWYEYTREIGAGILCFYAGNYFAYDIIFKQIN